MADVRKSQTINGAVVYVEGMGFVGTTSEVELPAIEFETFEGNGGVYKRDINTLMLKALTTKLKFGEYNKVLYESLGKHGTEETSIYVKWNVTGKKGNFSHVATFRGEIKKFESPKVEYGKETAASMELACSFYKLEEDGTTQLLIDLDAYVCEIDGKDVWQELRENIL
ncbi:MAG: hypothetical protein A2513_05220 [Sulfurimonas sp. RIFOXYD12_FULL_33_39]|uniref:phage major tail tube protein n=1 Tax=unclassified Sulfurimonas TaxID=2623549 RepID=UPI0008B52DC6|nr:MULTISPECIES: phage major tail tube protein [unclassified Sulfurimonas]OHE09521.1 MAG: hypothetical protein A2513_05220 [Sulfurimonas sp. RIFOXYD12_FULL_33_39]OHE12698.1 MAG: hypothetical protein A2530_03585 [Sulfurimonas sp. RIFOXYD2_FULL_34_21]